jgi:hypothetical protein
MKEKMELSTSMQESVLFPSDYIYETIWDMSEDKYDEFRDLAIQDKKRKFRLAQIENEGNDPLETGKSYGTPHDLALLYGRGRYEGDDQVPDGYDEKSTLGRPKEKVSDRNTQDNPFGKDRIGSVGAKVDNDQSDSTKPKYKGNSPLALEGKKILEKLKSREKQLIFETDLKSNSLLDESQLRE